ncbi:MAG: ShlB/FhaC/HecB family hemolysin secretion/activation protein [Stellaceae bacterium]
MTPSVPVTIPSLRVKPIKTPAFVLRRVVIEGSTIYGPAALRPLYRRYIGQRVNGATVARIAEALTVKYRNGGYILSHAVVRSINLRTGVVRIEALQGYIEKVQLDPLVYEVGKQGGILKKILRKIVRICHDGDHPVDGRPCPLNRAELERYLLLANDLPGVTATAVIAPSPHETGAADLFVTIHEKHFEISGTLDNRGTDYLGPLEAHETAALNDILGLYDRTEFDLAESIPISHLYLARVSEQIPLTSEGLRLALAYTHARAHPGNILGPLNLTDTTDSGDIILSYPWLRTRSQNLMLHADFNIQNSIASLSHSTLYDDRTRALELGGTYDLADRWFGVNLAEFSLTQGLPVFDPTARDSDTSSHQYAPPDFTKLNLELSRLQQLVPQWNLLAAVKGQYAFEPLLTPEQFGYGGEQYGRAYDNSEFLGDNGVAAKLELQFTPSWGPGLFGWSQGVTALQFYAFTDGGRVWLNPTSTEPGQPPHETGSSVGGGIRFSIANRFSGYIEVAEPLTSPVLARTDDGKNGWLPRVFFAISARY